MDQKGNNDGKISMQEAYNELGIPDLLSGLQPDEYNKLKKLTDKIPQALQKYTGEDGTFTLEEYTALKNDGQYRKFLEKYNAIPFNT